jgi:hypothetical protein
MIEEVRRDYSFSRNLSLFFSAFRHRARWHSLRENFMVVCDSKRLVSNWCPALHAGEGGMKGQAEEYASALWMIREGCQDPREIANEALKRGGDNRHRVPGAAINAADIAWSACPEKEDPNFAFIHGYLAGGARPIPSIPEDIDLVLGALERQRGYPVNVTQAYGPGFQVLVHFDRFNDAECFKDFCNRARQVAKEA